MNNESLPTEPSSETSLQEIRPGRFITINVSRQSNADTTVFLLHGAMGTLRQFDLLRKTESPLFTRCNIVSYDALGCGSSSKPHDRSAYASHQLIEDATQVVSKYATANNIIVGHSFGTSVAAHVYSNLSLSHNITSIILLSTTYHVPSGGHPIFKLPLFVLKCIHPYLSKQFNKLRYSPSTSEEMKAKFPKINGMNDIYVSKAFYTQLEWATEKDWQAITCPTLIIAGEDDQLTPPLRSKELFDKVLAGKKSNKLVVIEGAGHMIMLEKPKEVLATIEEFLETIQK